MGYKTNPKFSDLYQAALERAGAGNQDWMNNRDASVYQQALEKAAYAQLGPRFTQGINAIQGRLAGMGPLADSGAATALKAKLASGIYNTAAGQITGGQADLMSRLIQQQRAYKYQSDLMAQRKKMQKKGFWSTLLGIGGGVAGAALGGPAGAYAGYNVGNSVGGGSQASDAYYG